MKLARVLYVSLMLVGCAPAVAQQTAPKVVTPEEHFKMLEDNQQKIVGVLNFLYCSKSDKDGVEPKSPECPKPQPAAGEPNTTPAK